MALQSSIAPRNNNEPLLGPIVSSSGEITHSYRNWLEYKRLQIGEIISGVNRNAVNIVQLETDYTAADGAVTSAYITADAVVEANAASARATLSTTLTAAYEAADTAVGNNAATYTDAQITIVNTAYAAADAAEASARTTLQANLEAADTTLQANIDSEESARVTADTAEASSRETLSARFSGAIGSAIPDGGYQDSGFWNPSSQAVVGFDGASLFSKTNAWYGMLLSDDGAGGVQAHDFSSDYFNVTPGATYEITTHIWSGYAGFTGWVRPMIHVPAVQWQDAWATGPGSVTSDSSTTATATDMTSASFSGSETYEWTAPAGTTQIQFRTKASITGGTEVFIRYEMRLLPQAAAVTTLQANIDAEESARVTADAAEAAARTTLTAQVRGAESSLVLNAYFQEEFSGSATPPEWSSWDNGVGTWAARGVGEGYAFAVAPAAASNQGIRQNVAVTAGNKFLASAEVRRTLGGSTFAGAGVLVQWLNSGGSEIGRDSIVFATDATTSGVIDTAPDNVSRWEKEVTAPTGAVSANLYAMGHYSTFGSIAAAAGFNWRECNLTPISNAQAQVTVQASAIADIEGNLTARYGIAVDGGGNGSFISLEDGTTEPSAISLTSDEIILDGAVLTTGTVERTALSAAERDALGAEGVAANFYRQSSDPGSVPDGSWWADTGNSELNIRISSAWQKIADIGGDQFRASGTSYLTAEVSGSGSGTATTSAPSITISGDVGSLTYLWRQKSTDTLVSCSNTAIINPTFSRSMSAAPASAVQTLWTLYVTDATLGETIQWDVIVNFTNSF